MAFATAADVEARLGRDLTVAEEAAAEAVIETVTGLVLEVAGTAESSPVPTYYTALAVEKAVGAISNPSNLASESETLGAHTHAQTFPRSLDLGVFLSEREEYQVRRIANGLVSSSTRTHALPHDVYVTESE